MNIQKAWAQTVNLIKTNMVFDLLLIILFVAAINFPFKRKKKGGKGKGGGDK